MRTIHLLAVLASLAVLLCFVAIPTTAAEAPVAAAVKKVQAWEHLALTHRPQQNKGGPGAQINKLGREGWELVSVTESDRQGHERTTYYFKRPLP